MAGAEWTTPAPTIILNNWGNDAQNLFNLPTFAEICPIFIEAANRFCEGKKLDGATLRIGCVNLLKSDPTPEWLLIPMAELVVQDMRAAKIAIDLENGKAAIYDAGCCQTVAKDDLLANLLRIFTENFEILEPYLIPKLEA
ncbi:MAG: hypothetical protein UY51_C0004G0017 [Candidatus Jorgensenbacteria bacterium GW2011_GWB1_49_9]|nr:MAG: hypothetical protein UY51_C0004G0017 [Candidatus Jorgensenbacteria bacterium GW2011_GWB1_49_9]